MRWVAGGTFTLYLAHQPFLTLGAAIVEAAHGGVGMAIWMAALNLLACFLLAEIGERRKHVYARFFRRLAGRR